MVPIIYISPKILRPTPPNNYKSMYCTDVDEDLYDFSFI